MSVRAIPPSGVILVTQDPSGTIYCSTFDYGEPIDRGSTDAQAIDACAGGWLAGWAIDLPSWGGFGARSYGTWVALTM